MIYILFIICVFSHVTVGQSPVRRLIAKPSNKKCKTKDIVFVLDSSSSITKSNFQTMLDKCKEIVDDHNVGISATLFGLDVFSTGANNIIKLKDHTNKDDLNNAIDDVDYTGGLTRTYRALGLLVGSSFTTNNGHRKGAIKQAIVMTDGNSQQKMLTINAAKKARQSGIEIMAIGIGNNVDWEEILGITGPSKKPGLAFRVSSFSALKSFQISRLLPLRKC